MSRLGARWFDRMEQYLKIALKHSKVSVATPTSGPKRRISASRCDRRCSLIFVVIFDGSIIANRSSTFAAAKRISDYRIIISLIQYYQSNRTHQVLLHIPYLSKPKECR